MSVFNRWEDDLAAETAYMHGGVDGLIAFMRARLTPSPKEKRLRRLRDLADKQPDSVSKNPVASGDTSE